MAKYLNEEGVSLLLQNINSHINSKASNYLPLTGGEINGSIYLGDESIVGSVNFFDGPNGEFANIFANDNLYINSPTGINMVCNEILVRDSNDEMGYIDGIAAYATSLKTSRCIDGVMFDGAGDITHYGSSSTAASTAAKTVSITNFALKTGSKISVKFTNANTASSPTLNVSSTGAKYIRYNGATLPSTQYWAAGAVVEFIYDGTYWNVVGSVKDNNTTYSVATESTSGLVSTGSQTFGGIKTFSGINTDNINNNEGTLSIINNNTNNNITDYIVIQSTNGQIDLVSEFGVIVHNSSGNINTITANLIGNADTASVADKLSADININGWSFDGTGSIHYCNECATAASTVTKIVSWSNGVDHPSENINGTRLTVRFSYANTASSPKLQFHDHPEAPIYYNGAALTSDYFWKAGAVIDFVFYNSVWNIIGGVDSDKKVAQTNTTGNSNYPLLFTYNTSPTTGSSYGTRYSSNILLNPSKKYLSGATTISPYIDGHGSGCANNAVIYENNNCNLNLHGTIVNTGLFTHTGSNNTIDYVCIAEIYIVGPYPGYTNSPIMFEIVSRYQDWQNRVHVHFIYPGSATAFPTEVKVRHELPWDNRNIYLVKTADDSGSSSDGNYEKWHLVVKQGLKYENIDFVRASIPAYVKNYIKVVSSENHTYWNPTDWTDLVNGGSAIIVESELVSY